MSIPVIPVLDGVLLLPLVGMLEPERVIQMQQVMLAGIEQYRAHLVIIDITGIPLVDGSVARHLIDATYQARLLGSKCYVVGIRPEVAQTVVGLDVDLSTLQVFSNLHSAIAHALSYRRVSSGLRA